MSRPMLIWGAGAIGGSIGAAFVRAGEDVVFVDRAADHVAALNERGLQIVGPVESYRVPAKALLPQDVSGTFDRIVLCVKAHDTADATRTLVPHLATDGHVISAQNGLNERIIADIAGKQRTVGCFVNFGADYMQPGVVQYSGRGAAVVGEINGTKTDRIRDVHRLFKKFDRDAVLTSNIWGFLWSKMIYGGQLFVTAVTNEGIADLFAETRYRPLFTRLAHEIVAVAFAEGVRLEAFNGFDPNAFLPSASSAETTRSFDDMVAHNRRSVKTHSGIWRDLAIRKRKTEVDAQLGPAVEIGRQHGLALPITTRTIALIHEIEAGRRALSMANLDDLDRIGSPVAQPA